MPVQFTQFFNIQQTLAAAGGSLILSKASSLTIGPPPGRKPAPAAPNDDFNAADLHKDNASPLPKAFSGFSSRTADGVVHSIQFHQIPVERAA